MQTAVPAIAEPPASADSRRRRGFSAFAHRDFSYLLVGTMGSQLGDWIQTVGQGWLVYVLTHSAAQLGIFSFVRGIAVLVLTPFGGQIAGKANRRKLLAGSTFVGAVSAVALAVLVATGLIQLWHLYVTALIDGLVISVSQPARQVMVYDVVGAEDLTNAVALNAVGSNVTRIIGPSLGGVLIGTLGVSMCFFGQAAAYVVASAATFFIRTDGVRSLDTASMLHSIADGVRYSIHNRTVLTLLAIATIPSLLVYPYLRFMQVFAIDVLHIGAVGYGILYTGIGFGSIAGAVWVAGLGAYRRKGWAMMIGNAIYMAFIGLFALAHQPVVAFGCLIIAGVANTVYNTFNQTLLQFNIEDEYRGRVLALYLTVSSITPFGALLMGLMIDRWSAPSIVFLWSAFGTLLMLAIMLRSRRMREL